MPDYLHGMVLEATVEFLPRRFVRPLVISSGAITEITEVRVTVRVAVGSRIARGRGAIYLSDLWSWPDTALDHATRDNVLRSVCRHIAAELPQLVGEEPAHPLELGMRLHAAALDLPAHLPELCSLPTPPTPLALAMCLSPFDAAIHDAVGLALGRSAMEIYDQDQRFDTVDCWFDKTSAGATIHSLLRQEPIRAFDAWLVISREDDLQSLLDMWVQGRGYHAAKLKIAGAEVTADAQWTVEVFRALRETGVRTPRLTADSNGATPSPEAAAEYLARVRSLDEAAFDAIEYLEQPTGRDITGAAYDWRPVTAMKPVLLDEGLTGPEILPLAQEQGWSGLALKTCKGHSFALVAAAWAYQHGMSVALQDLTNPGLAALHAGIFAAYVPTINGVELNSAQFTPEANREWLPRLAPFFEPADGTHRLPETMPAGLGSEA